MAIGTAVGCGVAVGREVGAGRLVRVLAGVTLSVAEDVPAVGFGFAVLSAEQPAVSKTTVAVRESNILRMAAAFMLALYQKMCP